MLSKREKTDLLFDIGEKRKKKYSLKKIKKKLEKYFQKLNKVTTYKFFEDEDNNTYYNLLYFLTFLEKLCIEECGKKFKLKDIEDSISVFFEGNMTFRAATTLDKINKRLLKTKDKRIKEYPFHKGILDSKTFTIYIKNSEKKHLDTDWDIMNHI